MTSCIPGADPFKTALSHILECTYSTVATNLNTLTVPIQLIRDKECVLDWTSITHLTHPPNPSHRQEERATMSTAGQFSTKNPTLKRILREASELATSPSSDYHAAPLETDLFEWHFTLRGPPAPSPFENGIYHGRIVLPPAYPLKPPSFRFLTPTGRFEVNREICLSISGHHEETWQPAWGIRTALVAIRSFMDTSAGNQLGGMEASEEVRRRLAVQSRAHACLACGKRNEVIMREQDEAVREAGGESGAARKDEAVPEELRLAYRENLGENKVVAEASSGVEENIAPGMATSASAPSVSNAATITKAPASTPTQPQIQAQRPAAVQRPEVEVPAWIDKAIYGVIGAIIFLIFKKWLL
ncbi:Hypothetical protein R9X50_00206500 [Acrodontium crateriforme]|uniref:UBC core domain-containing protein n=1 Tax=Acrodontium crateriforme TaxID=150365 RepID=A0AAQ3M1T7_9PEZI|nr:Hypothetical protein R9X50_00206500 [Acrodontium crateriforme]